MRKRGTVEWRGGMWKAHIYMPDGAYPWVPMPGIGRHEEAKARLIAVTMQKSATTGGAVPIYRGLTLNEYVPTWIAWRKEQKLGSANEDLGKYEKHIAPLIGILPLEAITKRHLENVVAALDKKVRSAAIRWKTAMNIWGVVLALFRDASSSKNHSVRVLESNPTLGIAPPDKGDEVALQFLFPNEFLDLVSCEDVPLDRAQLYAVAVYSMARAGELFPLEWADTDLEHGNFHLHQAIDRVRQPKVTKGTKSKRARRVPIEPALLPMLTVMSESATGPRVFPKIPRADGKDGLASILREDLRLAGVVRPELHVNDTATQRRIRFHDLRATGLTWLAVRGDDVLKIKNRAGHSDFATTQRYIRTAEILGDQFGTPFPALPGRLVSSTKNQPINQKHPINIGKMAIPTGIEPAWESRETSRKDSERSASANAVQPNRDLSNTHSSDSSEPRDVDRIATALALAARAERWDVVSDLSRLLAEMKRSDPENPAGLRIVKGAKP